MTVNRQWLINGNPRGRAILTSDFKPVESVLTPLAQNHVRIKVSYLSFDPSQKGQMENIGYATETAIGEVMRAQGIGEVVESNSPEINPGDQVIGLLGWQEFADMADTDVSVLTNDHLLTAHLGPLGLTGLTAFFGLLRSGMPEPGNNLLISGAAGAVGSLTGQIGKIYGCNVVGVAGNQDKCNWLTQEASFDRALNYKTDDIKAKLKSIFPTGIDIFFDNTGGPTLNIALARIAVGARVILCGAISQYEKSELPPGPSHYFNLVLKRATMRGILVTDYQSEYETARQQIRDWIETGKITYKEDIQHGFENIPAILNRLFSGKNFGKQLLKL